MARSGYCSATDANATNRSGSPHRTRRASRSARVMTRLARSRSDLYHYGIDAERLDVDALFVHFPQAISARMTSGRRRDFTPYSAIASGIAQCACTSTVLTRRPFTTTSRRRRARLRVDVCGLHEIAAEKGDRGARAGHAIDELSSRWDLFSLLVHTLGARGCEHSFKPVEPPSGRPLPPCRPSGSSETCRTTRSECSSDPRSRFPSPFSVPS